ncbi:MAG: phosphotransferase enzyme family protein [Sphingomonadales bacterium]
MHNPLLQEATKALGTAFDRSTCQPIGHGLIHRSFCIESSHGQRVFLQQINQQVFARPAWITANLVEIYTAFQKKDCAQLLAKPKTFANGEWLFLDSDGQYWRSSEFIVGSTFHSAVNIQQLGKAVKSFAGFTALLCDIDTASLYCTLTDFHNLSLRYSQFQQATQQGDPKRTTEVAQLIEELHKRIGYVKLYEQITASGGDFKKRVMHHDAKISNLLFDTGGQRVLAVTDLDTTMPGFFFSDLGDMIRSMAGSTSENSTMPEQAVIVPELYETIVDTYYSGIKSALTKTEAEWLHSAGLLMIYMQTLRFLTDYLLGDPYYQTTRPGQNRDRARHQFALLRSLEQWLKMKYQFSIGQF